MRHAGGLHRFALAAIGHPPNMPVILIADGIARIPEFRSHTGIKRIFKHPAEFSVFYLARTFNTELKIQPPVIDRPDLIHIEKLKS